MNTLKGNQSKRATRTHLAWLLPILALSPLALAAKGCDNSGVVGDNCASAKDCNTAGKGGTSSAPDGECGGLLGKTCNADQFCSFPAGAACGNADQTGTCKDRPNECNDIYSPVCGCDGKTYANDCEANGAGVSVASSGECGGGTGGTGAGGTGAGGSSGGGGGQCGGFLPGTCPTDQYCHFPVETQCGSGDQTGSCTPIPEGCSKELNQVCGCDDVTYGNPCMAAAAGVSVLHQGACGKACGEIGGCGADEFCNFPPESKCGIADGPGVCTKLPPKGSACDAVYAPVCGCDGKTYGNDCEALVAGASVSHTGACGSTAGDCGGFTGAECKTGFYCDYALDQMCGAADGQGTCKEIPDACPDNVDPVCGCDGKDYFNACEAAAKGTAVSYAGKCK